MSTKTAEIEKLETRLGEVEEAISRIVTGVQQYSKGDVSTREADLRQLRDLETTLRKRLARKNGQRPTASAANLSGLGYS